MCSKNQLTSLDGAPEIINSYFDCSDNSLTSLKGAPRIIEGSFYCRANNITSLEGAPQIVEGEIYFSANPITQAAVRKIFLSMEEENITFEEAVALCWNNTTEEDRIYLAKHNQDLSPEEKKGYEALSRYRGRII
jgi:hypothetical protein